MAKQFQIAIVATIIVAAFCYEYDATQESVHVNPLGPPAHAYNPHTVNNAQGHRYYTNSEQDKIYEYESPLSDAQLAALKIRAKEIKQQRAVNGTAHSHQAPAQRKKFDEMNENEQKLAKLRYLKSEPKKTEKDLETEEYEKKAFVARLKLEEQAAKAQELNNEKLWKLRNIHIQKHAGLKKQALKEKFDDWFDEMFRKMFREMFAKTTSETAGLMTEEFINNPEKLLIESQKK